MINKKTKKYKLQRGGTNSKPKPKKIYSETEAQKKAERTYLGKTVKRGFIPVLSAFYMRTPGIGPYSKTGYTSRALSRFQVGTPEDTETVKANKELIKAIYSNPKFEPTLEQKEQMEKILKITKENPTSYLNSENYKQTVSNYAKALRTKTQAIENYKSQYMSGEKQKIDYLEKFQEILKKKNNTTTIPENQYLNVSLEEKPPPRPTTPKPNI